MSSKIYTMEYTDNGACFHDLDENHLAEVAKNDDGEYELQEGTLRMPVASYHDLSAAIDHVREELMHRGYHEAE